MGKRQFRISLNDLLNKTNDILGRKVQVILNGNRVLTGSLEVVSASELLLKDARFNLHRISPNDVSEVVYDQETLY